MNKKTIIPQRHFTYKELMTLDDRTYVNDYLLEKIEYLKNRKQDLLEENKELMNKYKDFESILKSMEEDMLYYVRLTEKITNDLKCGLDDVEEIWCLFENNDFFLDEKKKNEDTIKRLKSYVDSLANDQEITIEPFVSNDYVGDIKLKKATSDSIDYLLKKEKWYTTKNNVFQKRAAKLSKKHIVNKIIAVDFDGTLCENNYPLIGAPNYHLIRQLKHLQDKNTLILWTCRNGEQLKDAVKFCEDYGLHFNYVNENTKEVLEQYGGIDNRKITADIYLDDKARSVL